MNISPKKDMEGAKTVISVMAISALTNTLNKGQERRCYKSRSKWESLK